MDMGIRGPHIHMIIGTRVPIFIGIWGPGVPKVGGPHFHMTPALQNRQYFCSRSNFEEQEIP